MSETRDDWYQFRNLLLVGDFEAASSMLALQPNLISERNSIGESVLHYLAVEDCQDEIEWLVDRGAELNVTDDFGVPLLFDVALLGYRDLFKWLIIHGVDVNRLGPHGKTIEDYLADMGNDEMLEFVKHEIKVLGPTSGSNRAP